MYSRYTAGANTATTTDPSNAATGTDSAGTGGTNSQDSTDDPAEAPAESVESWLLVPPVPAESVPVAAFEGSVV
jgi:hypothetical protein